MDPRSLPVRDSGRAAMAASSNVRVGQLGLYRHPGVQIRLLPSRRVNGLNPIAEGGLQCLRLFPFWVALTVGACRGDQQDEY